MLHAQTYTGSVLHAFSGTDGSDPFGGLLQGPDGNFYGTTRDGGPDSYGTVYQVTPTGTVTVLYSFTGGQDGALPNSGLVMASNGFLYGTTTMDGQNGGGTIFRITPSGAILTVYNFCSQSGCSDGETPSGLILGSDGGLWGSTVIGGTGENGNGGTIFEFSLATYSVATLYSFTFDNDGGTPEAGLVQGSNGSYYGTTEFGGLGGSNFGTVFSYAPKTGSTNIVYSFCQLANCTDGAYPESGLTQGIDGNFYGATVNGGANGVGELYKITLAGVLTVLYSFCGSSSCTDGGNPTTNLVLGSDGNFYGGSTTEFQLTPSGTFTQLPQFTGGKGGAYGIVQTDDGNFYGTAGIGSPNAGSVFKTTVSPALAAPVQLSLSSSSVMAGTVFTLSWRVLNAPSTTMQQCFIFQTLNGVTTAIGTGPSTYSNGVYSGSAQMLEDAIGTYLLALGCGGESGFATLQVTGDTATATLAASGNTLTVGQPVTLQTTVSGSNGTPTGSVTYSVEGINLGTAQLNSSGVASFTASTNGEPPGSYPVQAKYSGNSRYASAVAPLVTVTLNKAPTATTITASPTSVAPPGEVTLSATVKRNASGATGTPTGTVTFAVETVTLATVKVNSSGVATLTASSTGYPAGSYPVRAIYNGDGSDVTSTSSSVTVTLK